MAGHGPSDPTVRYNLDDTTAMMRENINRISQRGERLDSLQIKSDNLAVSANGYRRGANELRKKMWRKRMKMWSCLAGGIVVLILVIVLSIFGAKRVKALQS